MSWRTTIVWGALLLLAALLAWVAAAGLTACAAWAGEAPPTPAPTPTAPTEMRVMRVTTTAAPAAPSARPLPALDARAPLPPMPDEVSARGWFGMQFTCTQCSIRPRTADAAPVWDFADPPEIYRIEPGSPAARGGLKPGDVLLRIDGTPIDSPEGGKRFGAVMPGQRVRWTVKRADGLHAVVVIAGERPGPTMTREMQIMKLSEQLDRMREMQDMAAVRRAVEQARAQMAQLGHEQRTAMRLARGSALEQPLRYEGTVGCSDVDVHGTSGVNVTVSQEGDEIVITTCDAVVRVKAGERK